MQQQVKQKFNIDFMAKRKVGFALSAILLLVSIAGLAVRGLNYGIDFTGGYLVEIGFENSVELSDVRQALEDNGVKSAIVQHFGTSKDILIRLAPKVVNSLDVEKQAEVSDEVVAIVRQQHPDAEMRRIEFVGPQVGEQLKNQGGLAMLLALGCIMVYIMIRFERRFAVGAVAALAHDVLITLGVFSLLQIAFDLTILAALLAVIGYSLNDTIVVFDRIRENFRRIRKGTAVEVTNISINQTLSRTLMTSGTTLLVLLSLFFLGGEIIHGFALALIVGVLIGTYSSIFVASPVVLALGLSREDLLPVKKEGAELDRIP